MFMFMFMVMFKKVKILSSFHSWLFYNLKCIVSNEMNKMRWDLIRHTSSDFFSIFCWFFFNLLITNQIEGLFYNEFLPHFFLYSVNVSVSVFSIVWIMSSNQLIKYDFFFDFFLQNDFFKKKKKTWKCDNFSKYQNMIFQRDLKKKKLHFHELSCIFWNINK